MEELANVEAERGNSEYIAADAKFAKVHSGIMGNRNKEKATDIMISGKERTASKEMCDFFDTKYIFITAHSGQYDCIQAAVRQRESDGGDCAGDCDEKNTSY